MNIYISNEKNYFKLVKNQVQMTKREESDKMKKLFNV